jgi:hypothetical protein
LWFDRALCVHLNGYELPSRRVTGSPRRAVEPSARKRGKVKSSPGVQRTLGGKTAL